MKIIRDGKEIKLTESEMREAWKEVERNDTIYIIYCKAREMNVEVPEEKMDILIENIYSTLHNNDSYSESYWLSLEYCIEDMLEEE